MTPSNPSDSSTAAAPAALPTRGVVLTSAARVYDWLEPWMLFGQQRPLVQAALDALEPHRDGEYLDVGCGTGLLAAAIASRLGEGHAVGIDASRLMIDEATRCRGNHRCRFQAAVAEELPFSDASFDGVVSSMFFHHVSRDLKAQCARELCRVLKPGGRLVVIDLDRPWTWFGYFYGYSGYVLFRQPEIRENLVGELPPLLREGGFRDLARGQFAALGCIRLWTGTRPCSA